MIKVEIKKREISNGYYSLYLNYSPPILSPKNGKLIRKEFLKAHIHIKPKNKQELNLNKEILQRANIIKARRENDLNKPEIYTDDEKEKLRIKGLGERNFLEYFIKLRDKRVGSNYSNWDSTYNYLNTFTKGSLKFNEINVVLLEEFKDFLLATKSARSSKDYLSQNSAVSYFNKVKAALKQAFKEDILQIDMSSRVSSIKTKETRREFLTEVELIKLIKTPCKKELIKRCAIFSALTGLRFSDIQKLKWGEIEEIDSGNIVINYTQKKTKAVEVLPISKQTLDYMGERKEPNDNVFEGLKYSAYNNKHLYNWIDNAGITKDITFHCFRHSYATIQLSKGTALYTVSKLLGHKNIKTTQLYAKVVDQLKRDSVNKINLNF